MPHFSYRSTSAIAFVFVFTLTSLMPAPSALADVDSTHDVKIGPNTGSGQQLGASLATGDFNNDGYVDLIAGAFTTDALFIYNGTASGLSTGASTILSGTSSTRFGYSVAAADVNNDGYDDVVVGATLYSSNTGRVYVYYGGATMDTTADVIFTGEATGNTFGTSIAAGDVNDDGYADVIVGAQGYSSNSGRMYVFYGGASMDNTADLTLTGNAGENLGIRVAIAGDVDGDGDQEVLVGLSSYSSSTGRAYLLYGGTDIDATPDVTFTGASAGDTFGSAVAGAGDVNNDGYDDVVIGAYKYSSRTGRAYVYYGGASMDSTADVTFTGENASDDFGVSVFGAGDLNVDGYDDVIVGSEAYPAGDTIGRGYLFYGGASMDGTVDVVFSPDPAGDWNAFTGIWTPFAAADLNNDGGRDLVIGSYGAENGNYDGAIFIFNGEAVASSSSSSSSSSSVAAAPAPQSGGGSRRKSTLDALIKDATRRFGSSSSQSSRSSAASLAPHPAASPLVQRAELRRKARLEMLQRAAKRREARQLRRGL